MGVRLPAWPRGRGNRKDSAIPKFLRSVRKCAIQTITRRVCTCSVCSRTLVLHRICQRKAPVHVAYLSVAILPASGTIRVKRKTRFFLLIRDSPVQYVPILEFTVFCPHRTAQHISCNSAGFRVLRCRRCGHRHVGLLHNEFAPNGRILALRVQGVRNDSLHYRALATAAINPAKAEGLVLVIIRGCCRVEISDLVVAIFARVEALYIVTGARIPRARCALFNRGRLRSDQVIPLVTTVSVPSAACLTISRVICWPTFTVAGVCGLSISIPFFQ